MPSDQLFSEHSSVHRDLFLLSQPSQVLIELIGSVIPEFAFFTCDVQWRFTYLSSNASSVFGHNPNCAIGRSFLDTLSKTEDYVEIAKNQFNPHHSPTPSTFQVELVGDENRKLPLWVKHAPLLYEGTVIGLAAIAKRPDSDVTSIEELVARASSLSKGQREVIELAVAGKMNKTIARELGIAVRTVEARRAKAKKILQAPSNSQLVQLWLLIKQAEGNPQSLDRLSCNLNEQDVP